jgi:serine/threonine-protein phosphatase 2B regulatory subunit
MTVLQVMSGALTQYDVEEVSAHCDGVCTCYHASLSADVWIVHWLMLAVTQGELEALYKRFRSLDRGRKGYITAEEFLSIPELSINPLAQRLVRVFDSVNYKQFVKLLSAFSKHATKDAKLEFMFHVYDVDGDGARLVPCAAMTCCCGHVRSM